MEELTGVGWHSFGSLVAAGWTRRKADARPFSYYETRAMEDSDD
jgi:hypothetical protein